MEEKTVNQKTEEEKLAFLYEALMECPDCSQRMELRIIFQNCNIFHCSNCGGVKQTALRFSYWNEWEAVQKFLKEENNVRLREDD